MSTINDDYYTDHSSNFGGW